MIQIQTMTGEIVYQYLCWIYLCRNWMQLYTVTSSLLLLQSFR